MKKLILLSFSLLILFLFGIFTSNVVNADVQPNNKMSSLPSITYEQAMKSDKPFLLVFYADWCTYCQRLTPKIMRMQQEFKDYYNFALLNTDVKSNQKVFYDYGVNSYPSVYIIDGKYRKKAPISYEVYSDVGKFSKTMKAYIKMRKNYK